jgi:ADP-ribose pyrophosphatase YjhB (NUDIX family)
MPDYMSSERGNLLAELLEEVWEVNGGFIPEEAYRLLHKLVSWGAGEVLIARNDGQEVLLRNRAVDSWSGWHVPGGYIRPQESVQAFCDRTALEDADIHGGVVNIRQIATMKWLDHMFSWPLCMLLVCEVVEQIKERDDLRFFSVEHFPPAKEMLHSNHVLYLETYIEYFKHPERQCPIIGEPLRLG